MKKEKIKVYLLAIVGIVAVVGIVILVLNASSVSFYSEDYVGQASGTCDSDRICESGESKLCRDCRYIYCDNDDVCEAQEPNRRCSECHFAAGWYCDHDSVCESTGYPREPTTGECDDCP